MKFNILAEDLKTEIANVGTARDKHTDCEAMRGILIEVNVGKISLLAANGEYAIKKVMDLNMGYYGGKCAFVVGDEFIDIVNKLSDGEITITVVDDNKIEIVQKKFNCTVNVLSGDMFLKRTLKGDFVGTQKIDADVLNSMVKNVSHACAKRGYESDLIRTGIKLTSMAGRVQAVALDGYRIAICSAEYDSDNISIILSGRMLKEVSKLINNTVEIKQYGNTYMIDSNDYTITVGQLEGTYPDYKRIIPSEYKGELKVEAAQFGKAVDRLETVAKKNKKPIILEYTDGILTLSAESGNSTASEFFESEELRNSDSLRMGLNGEMLLDALKAMSGNIKIKYVGKYNPLVLESENGENTQVIFPIRIRD